MFIPFVFERRSAVCGREPSALDPLCISVNTDILSIVSDAEERYARFEKFDRWVATVRDPASRATEGVRTIGSRNMNAEASYEIAPLPDGRYALRYTLSYWSGSCHGCGTPWSAYDTREQCVEAFLEAARLHFNRPVHGSEITDGYRSQREAQIKMLKLLEGDGLFGFMEPESVITEDDPDDE